MRVEGRSVQARHNEYQGIYLLSATLASVCLPLFLSALLLERARMFLRSLVSFSLVMATCTVSVSGWWWWYRWVSKRQGMNIATSV